MFSCYFIRNTYSLTAIELPRDDINVAVLRTSLWTQVCENQSEVNGNRVSRLISQPIFRPSQMFPSCKTWESPTTPGSVLKIMSSALPIEPVGYCFIWSYPLLPLLPAFSPLVQNVYPGTPWICYSGISSHPIPWSRDIAKSAEARSEVPEMVPTCPARSSSPTASFILFYRSVDLWWPHIHVQDYQWSSGIPHGVHLHPADPHRAMLHSAFVQSHYEINCRPSFTTPMDTNWRFLFLEVLI